MLPPVTLDAAPRTARRSDSNRLEPADRPAHDWYRFILSYPPHLVRQYLDRFGLEVGASVLDPFCGTGTRAVRGASIYCVDDSLRLAFRSGNTPGSRGDYTGFRLVARIAP